MAITLDDDGVYVTLDSANASGAEDVVAAVAGVTFGITSLDLTFAVAGEQTLAVGGRNLKWQLPANGGVVRYYDPPLWGDTANSAIVLTSTAGAASGTIGYVSR